MMKTFIGSKERKEKKNFKWGGVCGLFNAGLVKSRVSGNRTHPVTLFVTPHTQRENTWSAILFYSCLPVLLFSGNVEEMGKKLTPFYLFCKKKLLF